MGDKWWPGTRCCGSAGTGRPWFALIWALSCTSKCAATLILDSYDYIVIGAGVAGGVVATRLAQGARSGESVLVLETGKDESTNPLLQPHFFFLDTKYSRLYRNYFSMEGANVNHRHMYHMSPKALGGGSAINAMVWTRGDPRDWQLWSQTTGLEGWTFEDVLPYYQRTETYEGFDPTGLRGKYGPVHVSTFEANPVSLAGVRTAAQSLGMPVTVDTNGRVHEGACILQRMIRGSRVLTAERQSSWTSYLQPAEATMDNLQVVTEVTVTRINIHRESKRADGVDFLLDGRCHAVTARKEVILSAGGHNSPRLLMLSGVGDERELRQVGIDVVADRPGVGRDMIDHINPGSLIFFGPPRQDYDGNLVAAYGRSGAVNELTPDVELGYIMGPPTEDPGLWGQVPSIHMFYCLMLNNDARGRIRLTTKDPLADPEIESGFFKTETDLRRVVGIFRQLFTWAEAMNAVLPLRAAATGPYALGLSSNSTDEEIIAEVKNKVDTHWHISNTVRMGGPSDPMAVVDGHFRVYGVTGLRVVDSSVMPINPNGHPQATIAMMAERAAEWILAGV